MENTGKVLFEDQTPQWYLALGDRWVGPLSAADVYQKILKQEVTWAHFVWKAGQPDWKRVCDVKTFQAAVPAVPAPAVQKQVEDASKPAVRTTARPVHVEEKEWFLHYNDAQFGPFSSEEISRFLRVGKIHGRVHIWRDQMKDWARLEAVKDFAADVAASAVIRAEKKKAPPAAPGKVGAKSAQSQTQAQERADKRQAPRKPILAKILMANQAEVIVAVCRDISVGGMQVLTDKIPGKPGTRIKLNVSPAGKGKGAKSDIQPFVAEGVIVRVLEDERGFSFRFERLPPASRRAIENYLEAAGI